MQTNNCIKSVIQNQFKYISNSFQKFRNFCFLFSLKFVYYYIFDKLFSNFDLTLITTLIVVNILTKRLFKMYLNHKESQTDSKGIEFFGIN